jgi:metallophosphoesterase (TIGR00282 family)
LKILMIGDIVGESGREALTATLPTLITLHSPDLIVVNGENATAGRGLTPHHAHQLFLAGADVITLGNHAWDQKDLAAYLQNEPRILRPANYPEGSPGRGCGVFIADNGVRVGVANIAGRVNMEPLENPFGHAEQILSFFQTEGVRVTIFDFHAEATSEKQAFGYYLDGRASAVLGTHTHVQTADEHILPGGTAYITDVGMTGPQHSVIGMTVEQVLKKFLTQRPVRFDVATGLAILNGVLLDVDSQTGKAEHISRIAIRDIIEKGIN